MNKTVSDIIAMHDDDMIPGIDVPLVQVRYNKLSLLLNMFSDELSESMNILEVLATNICGETDEEVAEDYDEETTSI